MQFKIMNGATSNSNLKKISIHFSHGATHLAKPQKGSSIYFAQMNPSTVFHSMFKTEQFSDFQLYLSSRCRTCRIHFHVNTGAVCKN